MNTLSKDEDAEFERLKANAEAIQLAPQVKAIIDAFKEYNPATHVAYVVFWEYNLSDSHLLSAIHTDMVEGFRLCADYDHLTQVHADQVIAFLRFLLTIPEITREAVINVND